MRMHPEFTGSPLNSSPLFGIRYPPDLTAPRSGRPSSLSPAASRCLNSVDTSPCWDGR